MADILFYFSHGLLNWACCIGINTKIQSFPPHLMFTLRDSYSLFSNKVSGNRLWCHGPFCKHILCYWRHDEREEAQEKTRSKSFIHPTLFENGVLYFTGFVQYRVCCVQNLPF